jgi:hypothetical protein
MYLHLQLHHRLMDYVQLQPATAPEPEHVPVAAVVIVTDRQ